MTTDDKLITNHSVYMALVFAWLVFVWSGTAYLVFWLGHSGWWFVLTFFISWPYFTPHARPYFTPHARPTKSPPPSGDDGSAAVIIAASQSSGSWSWSGDGGHSGSGNCDAGGGGCDGGGGGH